jgi:predicted ATP-binding protein involved in virulence
MILNPHNSMILIDEPEISLHPAWQQKIMQIYSKIGRNNQFIVATHSPQIIASVPYQNRILLRKEQNKIIPIHLNQPPSGLDVNTILSEIMGASPIPPEIVDLHRQYRALVENKKEQSPEALAIRQKLSEESEHSQFMQEMNFLIDLRDL